MEVIYLPKQAMMISGEKWRRRPS